MTITASSGDTPAIIQPEFDGLEEWRNRIMSRLLLVIMLLGICVTVPSIIAVYRAGLWHMAVIDMIAQTALVVLWQARFLSVKQKACVLAALTYAFGVGSMFAVGIVAQIYLIAFPLIFALFIGLRSAVLALVLNAATLMTLGLTVNPDLHITGLEHQPLLNWLAITVNFSYVSALITITTIVLLRGLEQSLTSRRDSELLYRALFENSPMGVSRIELDGRCSQANQKMCEICGHTMQEMLTLSTSDFIHPKDRDDDLARYRQLLAGEKKILHSAKRYVHSDGHTIWVEESASLLRDALGNPQSIILAVADISERRAFENRLRENEERLRLALDAASQAWFDVHLPTGIVTVSPEYPRMIGYEREEFETNLQNWLANVHTEDREALMASFNACMADGEQHQMEYRRRTKAGDWIWIRSVGKIVEWSADKQPQRMIGIHTDVSERKLAEASLRESELRYRALFESAGDSLFLMKGNLFIDCNPATLRIFGCRADQIIGKTPDFYSPEFQPNGHSSQPEAQIKISAALAGEPQYFEWQHKRLDGTLFDAMVTLNKVEIQGGTYLLASVRDITDQRRAEEERRIAAIAFESQEGIYVTDTDTRILRVNQAFTRITGYTAEETVGRTPSFLRSDRQDERYYEVLWKALAEKGMWQGEIWHTRKNGDVYPELLTVSAVKNSAGVITNFVATMIDITQRKASEKEIEQLAYYDLLTQLPNRRLLLDRLQQAIVASERHGHHGALLFIDLDNFKMLNDTQGHDVGDQLLQQVAQRVLTCVRECDTVARIGGDEFIVMLEDLSEDIAQAANSAESVGEKVIATLNQPYLLAGNEHHSTPSIGATLFIGYQNSVDEILKRADLAMYQAKAAGRNALRFFDPGMQTAVSNRVQMESELRAGLIRNEFVLHYQPQVNQQGALTGAEALIRWQHPRLGLTAPPMFIPLAEETGQILALGQWVLETACSQLLAWAERPQTRHLTLSVNVSARQFRSADFVDRALAVLERSGADPGKLRLELTESLLLQDVEDVIAKMTVLKSRGIGFSLDDFGTGYSSLAYLKRLPLYQLKIDQSFVRDILVDANDAAIAQTIVALAQSMGLQVMAEGVETTAQQIYLANIGCHAYQGYLFGRPDKASAIDAMCGVRS